MSHSASLHAEIEPLLSLEEPDTTQPTPRYSCYDCSPEVRFVRSPASALPLSFISALALAATAATQIYAYAALLCRDPSHCDDGERRKFSASVAIATTIANGFAPFTLSTFEALVKRNSRTSLAIWLFIRSMSVGALVLGVFIGHVGIVMSSQVFEGFASDNVLHFNLNTLHAREVDTKKVSRLIGSSLALYMIGISISPSISSLLHSFTDSFILAYGLFISATIYLFLVVKIPSSSNPDGQASCVSESRDTDDENPRFSLRTAISFPLAPFAFVLQDCRAFSIALVLFLYNTAQSYTFSAIMVHTSTRFGFSSRENGILLTIVHLAASLYLLCALFVTPRLAAFRPRGRVSSPLPPGAEDIRLRELNSILALASLMIQACALLWFGIIQEAWQVYLASALLAVGLAFPSFLKIEFASRFDVSQRPRALASLAAMEMSGSFVAPVTLGGIQTLWPGNGIFLAASGLAFLAGGILFTEIISNRRTIR
ncbi:hypothetical protein EKO27_g6419 [Xylaria grammica]|uniref:Major facilitator superfamily (MFS) profile domain-containing protein n=1 Tax=Xylaria grammica TaxID=363999 RepID=A0A439D2K7_9PEZI|nr:hypothetical protein EKO27_g6419 [Xylaria grammica]